MAKPRTQFQCRACGAVHPRWMGKCPDCSQWDSLEEQRIEKSAARDPQKGLAEGFTTALDPGQSPEALPITTLTDTLQAPPRLQTTIAELDRVLGGGLVPGSAVLIGGDPGIGKSTLLLQAAGKLGENNIRTLYVTSEESAHQVRLRAERLGAANSDQLFILADTNLARVIEQARRVNPAVMVIDSIQMIYKADLDASPGTIAQLRRCCTELVYLAKSSGISVVLVGHVTKEGALAGPKLLEHLVDATLYFEGDRHHAHRIIRAVKNRFGATLEVGVFEMTADGLREAPDGVTCSASAVGAEPRPGSALCPVLTGSRSMLVELQALTATGFVGAAKRRASGVDSNRLAMLIAVLEQHGGLRLADRDIFASAVGGVRVTEPGADLALALAIAGAQYRRALPAACAAIGEVGLGGEVRPVAQIESRLREAARLGCKRIIIPDGVETPPIKNLETLRVRDISRAIQLLQ